MDDVRPIACEAEYQRAIEEIAAFFEHQPEPGTPEGDRFDALAAVIEAYEDVHYPISEGSQKRSPG
jgi:HTH-type transcriptional regulator / antitoxin HigA